MKFSPEHSKEKKKKASYAVEHETLRHHKKKPFINQGHTVYSNSLRVLKRDIVKIYQSIFGMNCKQAR